MKRLGAFGLGLAVAAVAAVMIAGPWSSGGAGEPVRADPDEVYDPIVAGEDFPGGIRWVISRDGIRPVYEPEFVPAAAAGWDGQDLVIGLARGDEAKAYPVGFLGGREMVIDTIGGEPVVVAWCPLCGTATVHSRRLDGRVLLFGNQGALWGNAMTWWDHETGTIWSQPRGEAIAGPLEGSRVELLPSTMTTWDTWRADHPETVALDAPRRPTAARLDEMAIAVELAGEAAAYPAAAVQAAGVVNDLVGGVPVAIVIDPTAPGRWSVFSRRLEDSTLTLSVATGELTDTETGSVWDAVTGHALSGPHDGQRLDALPALTTYPDDFATFWPEGRMWAPEADVTDQAGA